MQRSAALYSFPLDDYQIAGYEALALSLEILVTAPTEANKTVMGDFTAWLALETSMQCLYTTPIKALSSQEHHDLVVWYGMDRVRLLTGDSSANGDTQAVVVTIEALRNMIYTSSAGLNNLSCIIMDEVHYLTDRFHDAM